MRSSERTSCARSFTRCSTRRHEDFEAAARIIENAIAANCRPVDILIGMIAPMLYEVGEEWKRGALSVDAEHRFTAFSEQVIGLLKSKVHVDGAGPVPLQGNTAVPDERGG